MSDAAYLARALGLSVVAGAMVAGPLPAQPPAKKPTPVEAAVAAAPVAVKAVGGLLGRKGPSKEAMIKDLAKGRLLLKGVRFLASSDALAEPIDADIAMLAETLAAMEGSFLLNMPAEARDKDAPDTTIARRRLTKLVAHLQVAGVSAERIGATGVHPPGQDPKAEAPKPGEPRPEVLPLRKALPQLEL